MTREFCGGPDCGAGHATYDHECIRRIVVGLCVRCGRSVRPNRIRCVPCIESSAKYRCYPPGAGA